MIETPRCTWVLYVRSDRNRVPLHDAQPPESNPHVHIFVCVQAPSASNCRPELPRKNPTKDRLDRHRAKSFKVPVHDKPQDGIIHDIGVEDDNEPPFGMVERDLASCPHRASLRDEPHVGMRRMPPPKDVPA